MPPGDPAPTTTFVAYGTPQPLSTATVKARDRSSFLPVHLQEVRDERGRKRLHGAFKGGFSAGYYNTVGSAEGWAPATFKSSRGERAKGGTSVARPEDFMDEEDLEDLRADVQVKATAAYDDLGSTQRDAESRTAASKTALQESKSLGQITERIMQDLVVPSADPIGDKLLRKMGWRPGQGVGPRAKRRFTSRPSGSTEEDDEFSRDLLFAPRDIQIAMVDGKKNSFGLGFDAFKAAPEFLTSKNQSPANGSSTIAQHKSNAVKTRSGFGVGILEEEDEEDVYDDGRTRQGHYDMTIDNDADNFSLLPSSTGFEELKNSTKNEISAQLCQDGRPPLQGFILANERLPEPHCAPLSQIPKDFTGVHVFPGHEPTKTVTTSNLQKNLTPDERRDILGEAAPNAPARSVFDYIPLKAQQRLEHLIAQAKEKTTRTIPRTESTVAAAALKGFMPFDNAPEKQARYRLYLEVMSTADSDESSEKALADIPDGELKEFSQSALMYRPLSNLMASRFTSATKPDIINYKEHANEKAQKESKVQAESQKSLDETEAGKRDMFGALTRSVSEWRPDRLLCKRFGVPNPYQVDSQGQVEEDKRQEELDKEMLNDRTMEKLMKERDRQFLDPESSIRTGEESSEGLGMAKPGRQVGINEEDEDEEPPVEKPSLDIFKAIFADSDDEEDIEDEERLASPLPNFLPNPLQKTSHTSTDATLSVYTSTNAPLPVFKPTDAHVSTMYNPSSNDDTAPSPITQSESQPVALFRPAFRKKQERSKQISHSPTKATSEAIASVNGVVKKSVNIDFDKELDFEERVIVPLQPSHHPELGKRAQVHEDESTVLFKKSKRDKKEKKKKRKRKDAIESENDEWIEAPPPTRISRPKASDFM